MYAGINYIYPELIIAIMSCFILIFDLFIKENKKFLIYYLTQITLIFSIFKLYDLPNDNALILFNGSFILDFFGIFTKIVILIISIVIFIYSKLYLSYIDLCKSEYFVLCLLSILGMMIMISSGNFLTLYLGLELLSLPLYSLIIANKSNISSEASMKYFIMGSVASGIFLFGVSLVYGVTGTIEFGLISKTILEDEVFSNITLQYGLVFIMAGLIFKFGAVPFHMWVPDVYQGSPIPITLFISTVPKIAALGMAYRLLSNSFSNINNELEFLFIIIGTLSLFIGNIFAIMQENIKRLLAYSAISHVGFIFLGFLVPDSSSYSAVIFYVITYVITTLGLFGIVIALSSKFKESELIKDFTGLGFSNPITALMMVIFLLSLAGVPPTVGFYAKFFILKNLVSYGYIELAIFSVLMSVVGVFYYLKIIKSMFFEDCDIIFNIRGISGFGLVLIVVNGLLVLFIGIFPMSIFKFCSLI